MDLRGFVSYSVKILYKYTCFQPLQGNGKMNEVKIIALSDMEVVTSDGESMIKTDLSRIHEDHPLVKDSDSFRLGLACARLALLKGSSNVNYQSSRQDARQI